MRQRGFKCQVCGAICPSRRDHQRHLQKFNHWSNDCRRCARTFPSAEGLHDHEVSFHNYCRDCNRAFPTIQSIKTHLRSTYHRGKQASCPFCHRHYTYAAATYRFVRDKDPYGVITKKLIGWKGTVHYEVSDTCWNGIAYQCNLCHLEFNSLYALSQHVNSPRRAVSSANVCLLRRIQTNRSSTTARATDAVGSLRPSPPFSAIWRASAAAIPPLNTSKTKWETFSCQTAYSNIEYHDWD
ncbi:unnamed protein product [Clonostachys rosea]|uniref:C2H2-type domain-containing protein n=1 Tax=Bionectria ochroleuca TaxID=29856 RepID=A0ABY6UYK3_BIOOC|nr:unnamed protein product [Clonostachys rosea]